MQIVINLAPISLSNKKVNFYTCPRLPFLKKNATENACKSTCQNFLGGGGGGGGGGGAGGLPPDPPSGLGLRRSKLASSCTEVWPGTGRPVGAGCSRLIHLLNQVLIDQLITGLWDCEE